MVEVEAGTMRAGQQRQKRPSNKSDSKKQTAGQYRPVVFQVLSQKHLLSLAM